MEEEEEEEEEVGEEEGLVTGIEARMRAGSEGGSKGHPEKLSAGDGEGNTADREELSRKGGVTTR